MGGNPSNQRDPPWNFSLAAPRYGIGSVFGAPPQQEIYPLGRESAAAVNVPNLTDILQGARRLGYFSDVSTVLVKLLNLIQPDIALFGERDFQLVIVRRLVDDLFLSIDVVGCATWRDGDGLAVATANRQLTADERALAPRLYATLGEFAAKIDAGARDLVIMAAARLNAHRLTDNLRVRVIDR
jgi:pantoate--beta-alanine ligase